MEPAHAAGEACGQRTRCEEEQTQKAEQVRDGVCKIVAGFYFGKN